MGKSSINFARCNVMSAENHNLRLDAYMESVEKSANKTYTVFVDKTNANIHWVNPEYEGQSLSLILEGMRCEYLEKVHQTPQEKDRIRRVKNNKTGMLQEIRIAGWSPIREGVCLIKAETKLKDFKPFIAWLKAKGINVIRIDLHHDEGHVDPVSKERVYNHHAHIICDWIDHRTAKSIKLSKADMSEMQNQIAASLGLERGKSKEITHRTHMSPSVYREMVAGQKVVELLQKEQELKALLHSYETGINLAIPKLQNLGHQVDLALCGLWSFEVVKPTAQEQNCRNNLDRAYHQPVPTGIKEMDRYAAELVGGIEGVLGAILRISKQILKIQENIPWSSRKQLKHEADLENAVRNAESERDAATKQSKELIIIARERTEAANKAIKAAQERDAVTQEYMGRMDDLLRRAHVSEEETFERGYVAALKDVSSLSQERLDEQAYKMMREILIQAYRASKEKTKKEKSELNVEKNEMSQRHKNQQEKCAEIKTSYSSRRHR